MNEKELMEKWLAVFGQGVDPKMMEDHVTSYGNFLWHLFTWGKVPCLEGADAKKAFDELPHTEAIRFYGGYAGRIEEASQVGRLLSKEVMKDPMGDVYIVAKDFSWTYVRTHEPHCGPYLCIKSDALSYLNYKYGKNI